MKEGKHQLCCNQNSLFGNLYETHVQLVNCLEHHCVALDQSLLQIRGDQGRASGHKNTTHFGCPIALGVPHSDEVSSHVHHLKRNEGRENIDKKKVKNLRS